MLFWMIIQLVKKYSKPVKVKKNAKTHVKLEGPSLIENFAKMLHHKVVNPG